MRISDLSSDVCSSDLERVLISNWRRAMTRVVSLFLPTWSTDRVRRKAGDTAPPAEAPLVLIGHDGRRRVVVAADVAAQAAGLRVGMPATKAQVLVPGLLVQDAAPARTAERRVGKEWVSTVR